jgi:hypothetical protein
MKLYSDTPPDVRKRMIERYRAMSPEEKLARVGELTRMTWAMAQARQREWYPDDDERTQKIRLVSLWIPRDLMLLWFQWDPDVMGR